MMRLFFILLIFGLFGRNLSKDPNIEEEEIQAREFLKILNKHALENNNRVALAQWDYASNLTEENLKHQLAVTAEVAKKDKEDWLNLANYDWRRFSDEFIKRQFVRYSILGSAALPEEKHKKLNKIINDMEAIYSKAKICDFKNKTKCDLSLEPELRDILAKSRDAEELKHVWVEYRNVIGPQCRNLFKEYVDLSNEAARANNFTSTTNYWLFEYEDPNFQEKIKALWEQLKPLYLQIHAYVRHNLRQKYGDIISEKGPIPANLLGNMWAQSWQNIAEYTLPYPQSKEEDVDDELVKQNYTEEKIFKTAESFFTSINLSAMTDTFWKKSILTKPKDREIVCHASAWDFYDGEDFRIKQCTDITLESFLVAHHEMGHIEYFMQYKDLPAKFRTGANDGFHEAVGDLISLSVRSPTHLRKLGLIKSPSNHESELNNLYSVAMDKITFLPFGYLMDLWRWDVFDGKTSSDDYNCKWWELREKFQGVEPPVDRSEEDFDPAGKYHIIADVPYLRYFIAFILQFQFHRSLCEKAGQYEPNNPNKPLHLCDIYENKEAGNALKKMLALGASRPWPEALEIVTGQKTMDASAVLDYFKPIQKWLEEQNKKNGAYIGWEKSRRVCARSRKELHPNPTTTE